MMLRRLTGILMMSLVGVQAFADSYSDKQLFDAYMHDSMNVWKAFIDQADWEQLQDSERVRVVYYEYGYCGALMNLDKDNAMPYVQQFGRHIDALEDKLPVALWHVYKSAFSTYDLAVTMRGIFNHKKEIFRHAEQAVATDSLMPLSWGIQGHVHFYAPRLLGGNKELAQVEYERSDSIFTAHAEQYVCNWAYAAQALALAQCYAHNGKNDQAIEHTQIILRRWPEFQRAKDLLERLQHKKK